MNILIFRTNIINEIVKQAIDPLFDHHPLIQKWTVDLDDRDKVLRIETQSNSLENEIKYLLQNKGFMCEVLDY